MSAASAHRQRLRHARQASNKAVLSHYLHEHPNEVPPEVAAAFLIHGKRGVASLEAMLANRGQYQRTPSRRTIRARLRESRLGQIFTARAEAMERERRAHEQQRGMRELQKAIAQASSPK